MAVPTANPNPERMTEMESEKLGPSPRGRLLLTVFLSILLLAAVGIGLTGWPRQALPRLPDLGKLPSFQFVDQKGEAFDSARLAGKVWVGDFIFTSCAAACPLMMNRSVALQRIVEASPELRDDVRLVSFSIDPKRDTPERLDEFASGYGANPKLWHLLTGDEDAAVQLSLNGFFLAAEEPSGEDRRRDSATHSDRFGLVDRKGHLRGLYRPTESGAELERLRRDLVRLVEADVSPAVELPAP